MTQPAKAQEPTMEEILASIRRIIADDDAKPSPKPIDPSPPASAAQRPELIAPALPPEPSLHQADIDAMLESNGTSLTSAPTQPPQSAPVDDDALDVLELTESMAAQAQPAVAGFRTIDGNFDLVFEERPSEPEPVPPPPRDNRAAPMTQEALMSAATSAAVDSAFHTLAHTVLVQNARTLEDLVREMLRPMLKSWLDDNLPALVERLVRAEIERVSRGRT
jgi:cell pole-organizing protein PopZ